MQDYYIVLYDDKKNKEKEKKMKREKEEILDYLQKEIQEIRKLLLKKEKRDIKLFFNPFSGGDNSYYR